LFIVADLLTFSLPANEIGPEGAKAIAEALKINSSIQHLNLQCNEFLFSFLFKLTNKLKKTNSK
jgi:hypothetical protein